MTFKNPHLLTHLPIWWPKYSTQYGEVGERVALMHKEKVDHGTGWLIIEFTKAKHLAGQRYCINKKEAQTYPVTNNGSALMYEVPMSKLEAWDTNEELLETVDKLF